MDERKRKIKRRNKKKREREREKVNDIIRKKDIDLPRYCTIIYRANYANGVIFKNYFLQWVCF